MRKTSHHRPQPHIHSGVCWSWLVAASCSLLFLMSQGHTDTGSGSIYTRRTGKYYRSRPSAGEPVVKHSPAHHGHSAMGGGGCDAWTVGCLSVVSLKDDGRAGRPFRLFPKGKGNSSSLGVTHLRDQCNLGQVTPPLRAASVKWDRSLPTGLMSRLN